MGQTFVIGLGIVLLVYLLFCGFLYMGQRHFIYQPPKSAPAITDGLTSFKVGRISLNLTTRIVPGGKALIYFGGNAEDVSLSLGELTATYPHRSLYLMHYRGYAGSSGKPSEKVLLKDALALFDDAATRHNDIVVLGRSLGSAMAVHVAAERPVSALVLVTPFDSMLQLARGVFPIAPTALILKDHYLSLRRAPKVKAPTTLIVAGRDEVIARDRSDALLRAFGNDLARMVVLPETGHNDISENIGYASALRSIRINPNFESNPVGAP